MRELVELSVENLEQVVAAAPYSQYHQMLLSIKRGELHEANIYQSQAGILAKTLNLQEKIVKEILENNSDKIDAETAKSALRTVTVDKKKKKIPADKSFIDKPETEPIKKTTAFDTAIDIDSIRKDKKKIKAKKKKKTKKKKGNTVAIDPHLSEFSKWLISKGYAAGENPLIPMGKGKKKKKKKKIEKELIKGQEVISEPLAALLEKQGHNDKAIEMYQKLSLIFPEKSSYFAAQIENLKNK